MTKIVHISSVHNSNDPRIRRKQLDSVLSEGWSATLITGDLLATDSDGVRVVTVRPGNRSRTVRFFVTSPLAIFRAFCEDADVYHFHDPELLLWAWILLVKRTPVVYDIHEDYVTALRQKTYLPRWLRVVASRVTGLAERVASVGFHRVVAEKYYRRRFAEGLPILNYPLSAMLDVGICFDAESRRTLYTGSVTVDRGALHMARLVRQRPDLGVVVIGQCAATVAAAMRREAGGGVERLQLSPEGKYVPFSEILTLYRQRNWLVGLALFPDTDHYRDKELTKFFEYMAVGLPIVASNFPVWRALIVGNSVGLCVDPENPVEISEALTWLRENPREAMAMAQRGRDLVRSIYNWESEGRKLIAFYRELTGQ